MCIRDRSLLRKYKNEPTKAQLSLLVADVGAGTPLSAEIVSDKDEEMKINFKYTFRLNDQDVVINTEVNYVPKKYCAVVYTTIDSFVLLGHFSDEFIALANYLSTKLERFSIEIQDRGRFQGRSLICAYDSNWEVIIDLMVALDTAVIVFREIANFVHGATNKPHKNNRRFQEITKRIKDHLKEYEEEIQKIDLRDYSVQ
eukprot:TRINITY_DN4953_c0_g1_i6.p1 TRINITY_DN4953_c0_g1~~TRINITY_DN4953_c0_g1_i6.p1  ORF type:complete len:220 (+),score=43.27 TRINITY_DN4953_c0_g1_i6:62-661(+)